MSFSQFYQDGGVFMHLITLTAIGATVSIVRRVKASRAVLARREPDEHPLDGGATTSLIAAAVLMGLAGTLMGFIECAYAVKTVAVEHRLSALVMGGSIAIIPLTWASLISTPIVLAHAALRPFESRLRLRLGTSER